MLFEKKKPEDKPWPPASAPELGPGTGEMQPGHKDEGSVYHPPQAISGFEGGSQ